jgi:hypothetical protein
VGEFKVKGEDFSLADFTWEGGSEVGDADEEDIKSEDEDLDFEDQDYVHLLWTLALVARKYLAVSVNSTPSERAFSQAKLLYLIYATDLAHKL